MILSLCYILSFTKDLWVLSFSLLISRFDNDKDSYVISFYYTVYFLLFFYIGDQTTIRTQRSLVMLYITSLVLKDMRQRKELLSVRLDVVERFL